jgi:hypothetical protein
MDDVLREAIEKDLYNELRWLLSASTQWYAHDQLIGEPPQVPLIKEPCHDLKVYTMDSAFLHARSLYEFFTATKTRPDRLTWRDYSQTSPQTSAKYEQFRTPLHGRLMHLNKDRSEYDGIKSEVVEIAKDVLILWDAFSAALAADPNLRPYADLLGRYREVARAEAAHVAEQYKEFGFQSPFS